MAFAGTQHQTACEWQGLLLTTANDCKTEARDKALLAREWINMERLKRELRGIPPLASHKLSELLRSAKADAAPRATPLELESELVIDESKESLNPQTVTAPPDPEPTMANG